MTVSVGSLFFSSSRRQSTCILERGLYSPDLSVLNSECYLLCAQSLCQVEQRVTSMLCSNYGNRTSLLSVQLDRTSIYCSKFALYRDCIQRET
jgi:hypothetical protein